MVWLRLTVILCVVPSCLESLKDIFSGGIRGENIEGLPGLFVGPSPLEAQGRPLTAGDCAYLVRLHMNLWFYEHFIFVFSGALSKSKVAFSGPRRK